VMTIGNDSVGKFASTVATILIGAEMETLDVQPSVNVNTDVICVLPSLPGSTSTATSENDVVNTSDSMRGAAGQHDGAQKRDMVDE
jgi:hypothetical protein